MSARSEEEVWGLVPRLGVWGQKSPNVPLSRSDKREKEPFQRAPFVFSLSPDQNSEMISVQIWS